MNEEEFRKIAKEYAEMYFTKGINSTKIFYYVNELEKKVEQLETIRKEAIEFILDGRYGEDDDLESISLYMPDLLNILNKGSDKE